ncbi:hypothetical protein MKEN_00088000 [Mycena kentingensis (nom. inval.)]|nr:hypothetical protein MKEN_00088000 [Mycena kentingensis (nom. inval.)]
MDFSYPVALLLVLSFRAVQPLAWSYILYATICGSYSSWILVLAACEAIFHVYHIHLSKIVSRPWRHGTGNLVQLQIAFTRVLKAGLANLHSDAERPGSPNETITQLERNDPRAADFRNVLRTWFGRVPFSEIRALEVRKWIYWSIFNTDLPRNLSAAHQAVLEDTLRQLEMRLGSNIVEGSNPNALPMRMTLDKVNISPRPFMLYLAVFCVNRCLRWYYRARYDLRHGTHDGLEYLVYVPKDWNNETGPRPTVFFHGLGFGLLQYHFMLMDLLRFLPDRPLLVPLQPHISQDIFHPHFLEPICRRELADRVAGLLHKLGWVDLELPTDDVSKDDGLPSGQKGVTALSHSNGSYMHAWCLKAYPELFTRSCFADMVTVCLWEGDICHRFLYSTPTTGFELLVRYFVGTELGTANLLCRNFDWSSNSLWFEELPNARDPTKTLFLLGGKDTIINAHRVKKYLTSHGVREGLYFDEEAQHGDALERGSKGHTLVLEWLRDN